MGKLPHYFITHNTLARALVKLVNFLQKNNPELQLLQTDVRYYYKQACFHSYRCTNFIVIVIQAPLTIRPLNKLMDVYHVYKIPMTPPDNGEHYTIIATEIKAIIYHRDLDYYLTISDEAYLPTTDTLDLRNSPLLLQTRSKMSCGLALMEGDLITLKTYCRYYVVKGKILKGIVKITNNKFLLSNISRITIKCKQQNLTHSFVASEIQWFQAVHCGCVMEADSYVATATFLDCPVVDNISLSFTPKFLTNLPFLTECLTDNSKLNLIKDLSYLNQSIRASLSELSIASKEYNARLAIEEASKFDLAEIVNTTLNDQVMFENLGHWVITDLIKNHFHTKNFDFFNAFDWVVIFATVCGITALILVFIVQYKVRTLFALLAATRTSHAIEHGIPRHLAFQTTTPIPETVTMEKILFS